MYCDKAPPTTNPKSWKLEKALTACDTEFFCVLDDDTVLDLRGLRDAEIHLQHCDLYTGLPRYEVKGSAWSLLLAHFVNNNAILTYLPLLEFTQPLSINGMLYIVRTSAWRALGGFSPLFKEICDDFAVRCQAHSNGWRIAQGCTPHHVYTTIRSWRDYVSIQHRWNLFATILLSNQQMHLKATLTLLLALPPMLLWGSLGGIFMSKALLVACLALLILRHLTLVTLHRVAFRRASDLSPAISIAAELLQPFHFAHALCVKTIRWRNKVIHVSARDGFKLLQEVQS
jgi:ceramide glucosyltransferase